MATSQKLSKTQARNRKRREEVKNSKKGNVTSANAASTINGAESEGIEFEEELAWAIQQLELGIISNKDKKEAVEYSQKLLRILQSKKTPETKKKILLRQTFGDYKMKVKQSLLEQATASMKISQSSIKKINPEKKVGRVYRKSYTLQNANSGKNVDEKSTKDQAFKFNFLEENIEQ
ncbi:UPF0488 protein C8orf33-like protein [Trichoplax sp. H2]|nr:UPF0488 protein C8orf33-like protein [Trichoplax sp. H2]|eukprot:RDD44192.1 UPF0488 protein C8orf33-like protein [Trichoplax sp. H2]